MDKDFPSLSIVVPTYCEEENIESHYNETMKAIKEFRKENQLGIDYEYLVIDNLSNDGTVDIVRDMQKIDPCITLVINKKNYGPVISPFKGLEIAKGDLKILIAADHQEPPRLITKMLNMMNQDRDLDAVIAVKKKSSENMILWWCRGLYYKVLKFLGMSQSSQRYSGFGIYKKELIESLSELNLYEPSLRLYIPLYAQKLDAINYIHEERRHGSSTYNIYDYVKETIKNIARNNSKLPNIAGKVTMFSIFFSIVLTTILIASKFLAWNFFSPGVATLLIFQAIFFGGSLAFQAVIIDKIEILGSRINSKDTEYEATLVKNGATNKLKI